MELFVVIYYLALVNPQIVRIGPHHLGRHRPTRQQGEFLLFHRLKIPHPNMQIVFGLNQRNTLTATGKRQSAARCFIGRQRIIAIV